MGEHEESLVKIVQESDVIQKVLQAKPPAGGNVINILMLQKIDNVEAKRAEVKEVKSELMNLDNFMDSLPHPKLDNLVMLACRGSLARFGTMVKASEYLGVDRRSTLWEQVKRSGNEELNKVSKNLIQKM